MAKVGPDVIKPHERNSLNGVGFVLRWTAYPGVLGPEHPNVPKVLDNYAALLRETGRADEAAEMEARAQAIRAKYK